MERQRPILIICSRLDLPGGIERAVANTANLFVENDRKVCLLILDVNKQSFYSLDPRMEILQHPLSFGITPDGNIITRKLKLLSDVLSLRKILKKIKPLMVISTEYPFTVAAVLTGCRKYTRLISWEHHHYHWLKRNGFWEKLYQLAYKRLDDIVCLNKDEALYYSRYTNVTIIPNFISDVKEKTEFDKSRTILSAGWLIPRKGIDLLLATAKEVLWANPGWKWKLIGKGEMENMVRSFISDEELEERFILQEPGATDIGNEYRNAEFFVLSSRFEAFPMVLLEALSNRLPCISFDCPSGPDEIIIHGEDGLLVEKEDVGALINAVNKLIRDSSIRQKMSTQAIKNVKRFSKEKIFSRWAALIDNE